MDVIFECFERCQICVVACWVVVESGSSETQHRTQEKDIQGINLNMMMHVNTFQYDHSLVGHPTHSVGNHTL